jgi:hypothetical protein
MPQQRAEERKAAPLSEREPSIPAKNAATRKKNFERCMALTNSLFFLVAVCPWISLQVFRRRQPPQEVAKIAGECVKLQPLNVGGERPSRRPVGQNFRSDVTTINFLAKTMPRLEHLIPVPRTIPLPQ